MHQAEDKQETSAGKAQLHSEQLELFYNYAEDLLVLVGFDGKFKNVNASFEKTLGWKIEEVIDKSIYDFIHTIDIEKTARKVKEHEKGFGAVRFENRYRCKDGSYKWVSWNSHTLPEKQIVVGVGRDVTQLKETEEVLRENERLYRSIFDNTQDGFQLVELIYDDDGHVCDFRFLRVNSAYERNTGLKADFVLGKNAKSFAPNLEQYWFDAYEKVDKTGQALHIINYNKDMDRWEDVYNYKFGKRLIGSLFRDVTHQKKLEEQLKEQERLATIGQTAGMVGHDIRNPLQAIMSDVFLAKTELVATPESKEKKNIQESLTEIEKEIDYINKIVQDLQDYAKPLNPNPIEADLRLVIDRVLEKNDLPQNVEVIVKVQDNAKRFVADADYLTRILYNLVINSFQAMPNGGRLTIHAYKQANDIVITVKDTGVGIPKAKQGKMFTPLFTTKSKGQGFGLAAVKRLTESLGGTVTFESHEGKGTTFAIRLPQSPKQKN